MATPTSSSCAAAAATDVGCTNEVDFSRLRTASHHGVGSLRPRRPDSAWLYASCASRSVVTVRCGVWISKHPARDGDVIQIAHRQLDLLRKRQQGDVLGRWVHDGIATG